MDTANRNRPAGRRLCRAVTAILLALLLLGLSGCGRIIDKLKSYRSSETERPAATQPTEPGPRPSETATPSAPPTSEIPVLPTEPPAPSTEPPVPSTEPPAPSTEPPAPLTEPDNPVLPPDPGYDRSPILGSWGWAETVRLDPDCSIDVEEAEVDTIWFNEDGYAELYRGDPFCTGSEASEFGEYVITDVTGGVYTIEMVLSACMVSPHLVVIRFVPEQDGLFCTIERVSGDLLIPDDVLFKRDFSMEGWWSNVTNSFADSACGIIPEKEAPGYSGGQVVAVGDDLYTVDDHSVLRIRDGRVIRIFTTADEMNSYTLTTNGNYLYALSARSGILEVELWCNIACWMGSVSDSNDPMAGDLELCCYGGGYLYLTGKSASGQYGMRTGYNGVNPPEIFSGRHFLGCRDGILCEIDSTSNFDEGPCGIRFLRAEDETEIFSVDYATGAVWYLDAWYVTTNYRGYDPDGEYGCVLYRVRKNDVRMIAFWNDAATGRIHGDCVILEDPDYEGMAFRLFDGEPLNAGLMTPKNAWGESGMYTYLFDEKTGRHFVCELYGGVGGIGEIYTAAWDGSLYDCGTCPARIPVCIYDGFVYAYDPGHGIYRDDYDPTVHVLKLDLPN